MRRWIAALAVAGAVGLGVSGCGAPGGADGNLVDDWAAMGEPTLFTPEARTCHPGSFAETVYLSSYFPVDCSASHQVETIHVGTFTGSLDATTPPAAGSAPRRAAYAECDRQARSFLGADWRVARLWLGVAIPSERAWLAGARWFRCDLVEVIEVEENGLPTSRTGSLEGALRSPGPLHLTCYAATVDRNRQVDRMPAVDCDKPHNSEFAGVWQAPEDLGYPDEERDWQAFFDGCYGVVARYVEVPHSSVRFRTAVVALPARPDDWKAGDRGVRCYLWSSDRRLTRSLKGAGPDGLPIRTG
jgi:hypothetical protein